MADQQQNSYLSRALSRLLRPLVRLLLRQGMSFQSFVDIARGVFVDVAHNEFALPGKKQTAARVALLTGVNRKDVAKLLKEDSASDTANEYLHPVSRILSGWLYDKRFHDGSGSPAMLALEEGDRSFAALVRDYGNDTTLRAALDELVAKGNVTVVGKMVQLTQHVYLPDGDAEQQMRIFGNAAHDLLSTLEYNLDGNNPDKRMQRSVIYCNVPIEASALIQSRSAEDGQKFLESVNSWLSSYDRDSNAELRGSGQLRVGVGVYYFEEDVQDESS